MKYVFAIDPGTGSSSPAGVALLDMKEKKVIWSANVWPIGYKAKLKMPVHHRIKLIRDQIEKLWDETVEEYGVDNIGVAMENFVMRGKGGATLQQFMGAVLTIFPVITPFCEVHNTTMKKFVGGTGKANKVKIGYKLLGVMPESKEYIQELMDLKEWDQVDAIGIGFTARFN